MHSLFKTDGINIIISCYQYIINIQKTTVKEDPTSLANKEWSLGDWAKKTFKRTEENQTSHCREACFKP